MNIGDEFFENFVALNLLFQVGQEFDVQVLKNNKTGEELYYKPLGIDANESLIEGVFLPTREDAETVTKIWNRIKDSDTELDPNPDNADFDSLLFRVTPHGKQLTLDVAPTKNFRNDHGLRDAFVERVVNFMSDDDMTFTSFDESKVTDLGLDENTAVTFLRNAIDYHRYYTHNYDSPVASVKSPNSEEQADFLVIEQAPDHEDESVTYCLFPDEESLTKFVNSFEPGHNPFAPENIKDHALMVFEVLPTAMGIRFKETSHGKLKNWSMEQKRDLINKFLRVINNNPIIEF